MAPKPIRRVYVVAPATATTPQTTRENIARARRLCLLTLQRTGQAAFAGAAYYSDLVDSPDREESISAWAAGLHWLAVSDFAYVWTGNGETEEMKSEIEAAKRFNVDIFYDPPWFFGVDG